jgi:hypothetical protein
VIAHVAHTLNTSITDLMDMDLDEVLLWSREASEINKQKGGG